MKFIQADGLWYVLENEKCKGLWSPNSKRGVYQNTKNSVELFECTDISEFKFLVSTKEMKRKIAEAEQKMSADFGALLASYEGRTFNQAFFDEEAKITKAYAQAHEEAWAEHVKSYSE